jgi:hypothetical protein
MLYDMKKLSTTLKSIWSVKMSSKINNANPEIFMVQILSTMDLVSQ